MTYYVRDNHGSRVPLPNFEKKIKETKASLFKLEEEQGNMIRTLGTIKQEQGNMNRTLGTMKQEQGNMNRTLGTMKQEQDRMQLNLQIDRSSNSVLQKMQRSAKYFLLNEKHADCSFLVGATPNQVLFKAHRLVLAMASDVFQTMLYNSDSTGSVKTDEPVEIADITALAFKVMLKYIYSTDIKEVITETITAVQVCALHHAAQKFQLPNELSTSCVEFLLENITPSNVCSVYEYSKLIGLPVLEEKCKKIITSRTTDVFNSPEWSNIDVSTLFYILDQDSLQINSEVDVFNAVVVYFLSLSAKESKDSNENPPEIETEEDPKESVETEVSGPPQKIVLNLSGQNQANFEKALKKIRFLTMTAREFVEGPYESGILSEKEGSAILAHISKGCSYSLSYPVNFCRSISPRFTTSLGTTNA